MKYLLFITALFTIFAACDKPDDPVETYYLDKEMYDYVIFPTGSWWVYEEENSGQKDTVKVIKTDHLINDRTSIGYNFEMYFNKNFSSLYNAEFITRATAFTEGYLNKSVLEVESGTNLAVSTDFISEMENGDTLNLGQVGEIYAYKEDIIEISNTEYTNIRYFEKELETGPTHVKVSYFSKNIGLIKKELWNGELWNLIDYHINN